MDLLEEKMNLERYKDICQSLDQMRHEVSKLKDLLDNTRHKMRLKQNSAAGRVVRARIEQGNRG